MSRAIVVGSGAGGATAARELQGTFDVTILEAGQEFRPFSPALPTVERLKSTRLFFDERETQLAFRHMRVQKADGGMVLVTGKGVGGTTTICTGNGLRLDEDLRALGIDLDSEFDEMYREIPISTEHEQGWHRTTRELFAICQEMDLEPRRTPKMGAYARCVHCGRCVFGCPHGVKWDSRQFVNQAVDHGATLLTGCKVERVVIDRGRAVGVWARHGYGSEFYPADLVVLAGGGLATPAILQNSGIGCESRLFVDPVLCVAAHLPGNHQCYEVEMPFIVQRDGFIVSPYFDYLSFIFNRDWHYPAGDIVGVMIKLADENVGSVCGKTVHKSLTANDKQSLAAGVALCQEMLSHLGIQEEHTFLGTLNAGHPGGMLPLTEREAESFHHDRLPPNLYVADASLFPKSLGNPPILTIIAMAKRVSTICAREFEAGRI